MDTEVILWLWKETELRLEKTFVTWRRAAAGEKDAAAAVARECAMLALGSAGGGGTERGWLVMLAGEGGQSGEAEAIQKYCIQSLRTGRTLSSFFFAASLLVLSKT